VLKTAAVVRVSSVPHLVRKYNSTHVLLDVIVVGAGAAGLATAIFTKERAPGCRVTLLDGAKRPGAKILVSGGSRCNVTNAVVSEQDYWGGRSTIVRRVLRGFTVEQTVAFFRDSGVALHEEEDGKLFPDSNRSRDVLNALLARASSAGVALVPEARVTSITARDGAFDVETPARTFHAPVVVLATGGQSLPKSGSDGFGFQLARSLGHTIVPTTPALSPLMLADSGIHRTLSGVSHAAELSLRIDGRISIRLRGSLLWTHFGISGPVALNMSRHWLRARLEGKAATLTLSFQPGASFEGMEGHFTNVASARPRASVATAVAEMMPASVSTVLLERLEIDAALALAHLSRESRRRLVHALIEWPLDVTGDRGYSVAEATAGGVALDEIDPSSMASRRCPGLYLVGEMLDVDGRLGGFNFQWAWSSAFVCAHALGRRAS
jgi:predicted Rossmann fold flavoprotein